MSQDEGKLELNVAELISKAAEPSHALSKSLLEAAKVTGGALGWIEIFTQLRVTRAALLRVSNVPPSEVAKLEGAIDYCFTVKPPTPGQVLS